MIFVTVGTHEQPMDRLFRELERLAADGAIREPIRVQSGYTQFPFKHCAAQPLMPFQEIERSMRDARLVISHGGPATITQARAFGKTPIVVPRQARFDEHVNDHQVDFCRRLHSLGLILLVEDIGTLPHLIADYEIESKALAAKAARNPTGYGSKADLCEKLTRYCRQLEDHA
jgi:UDP-N-acetylglucosamine transferase subunit ALG13